MKTHRGIENGSLWSQIDVLACENDGTVLIDSDLPWCPRMEHWDYTHAKYCPGTRNTEISLFLCVTRLKTVRSKYAS